ncbi:hypothetical protein [Roseospira visakhapatnamensis]|uniref:hypothetical protein n=1 Tax=Roseospira visakhapatnamensis TaxID=390880 RepID=UPI00161B89C0|nr:hypothetical protein [Roseospira visakhapatnamensis]
MRRRTALAALLLAPAMAGLRVAAAPAQTPLGRVTAVRGPAGLIRYGVSQGLTRGAVVIGGDRLVTGERTKVSLGVNGGAVLTVGPATDITVTRYRTDRDGHDLTLTLARGSLRAHLAAGAQWRAVSIAAPTATATTQAGTLVIEADLFTATIYALDGPARVSITPDAPGGTAVARLGTGMGVDVARGARAIRPVPWTNRTAAPLLTRTTLR